MSMMIPELLLDWTFLWENMFRIGIYKGAVMSLMVETHVQAHMQNIILAIYFWFTKKWSYIFVL